MNQSWTSLMLQQYQRFSKNVVFTWNDTKVCIIVKYTLFFSSIIKLSIKTYLERFVFRRDNRQLASSSGSCCRPFPPQVPAATSSRQLKNEERWWNKLKLTQIQMPKKKHVCSTGNMLITLNLIESIILQWLKVSNKA